MIPPGDRRAFAIPLADVNIVSTPGVAKERGIAIDE
jgi:hypothetical protein